MKMINHGTLFLTSIMLVSRICDSTTTTTEMDPYPWLYPSTIKPKPPLIPTCNTHGKNDTNCLLPGTRAMTWESAHKYCRNKGGYLLAKGEQLRIVGYFWPQINMTLPRPMQNSTVHLRNLTTNDLTWTSLTLVDGHYQWLSQFPAQDDIDENEVELRVAANFDANEGWVEVSESEFPKLILSCSAYNKQSGARLKSQPAVFWSKDGVYLDFHTNHITPWLAYDPSKSNVPSMWSDESYPILKQGTFWCESWKPNSPSRIMSNKLLVTLKEWVVLILVAKRMESFSVSQDDAINKIKETFKPHFKSIDNYTVDIISIEKNVMNQGQTVLATYRVQVHIPLNNNTIHNILNLFHGNGQEYKRLYRENGYMNTSSIHFGTFCPKQDKRHQYGNNVVWPFTKASRIHPRNYRCRIEDNKLLPGICRWNYTHGTSIAFNSSVCHELEACPFGYTRIIGDLCASVSKPDIWEVGLENMYKTTHEKSILDLLGHYVGQTKDNSIYSFVKAFYFNNIIDPTVWLPIKRIVPHGPLEYMGPGLMDYPYNEFNHSNPFNISWGYHQPKSNLDCVALNLSTNELLTLDCSVSLPFVSLMNISGLDNIPTNDWKSLLPQLITKNPHCPEGWDSTELYTTNSVCFKIFANSLNLTWRAAQEFCKRKGAHLPTPGVGYLDWVFRQYLHDKNVSSVWMEGVSASTNKSKVDSLNWKPSTDYTLQYSSLNTDGWEKEKETSIKSNILCQMEILLKHKGEMNLYKGEVKKRKSKSRRPEIDSSDKICLDVIKISDNHTKIKCYANGKLISIERKNTSSCLHDTGNSQGYYECFLWTAHFPYLVKSNVFLNRATDILTFAISLVQNSVYRPEKHDSTFLSSSQELYTIECVVSFLNFLQNRISGIDIAANNFFYAPGKKYNELLYNFNIEMKMKSNSSITEYDMMLRFSKLFAQDETFSGCALASIQSTIGCIGEVTKVYGFIEKSLSWATVEGNKVVLPKELCINNEGEPVTRKCKGNFLNGFHWGEISDGCNGNPSNLTQTLWNISQRESSKPSEDLKTLSNLTANGASLRPADIHFVASKLQSLSKNEVSRELSLEEVVETLNNVMEADDVAFETVQKKLNTSGILFEAFENIAFNVKLPSSVGDQTLNVTKKLISVERLDLEINSSVIGYQSLNGGEKQVTLKKDFKEASLRGDAAIIFPENLTYLVATKAGKSANMQSQKDAQQKVQLTFAVYRTPKLFQDFKSFPNHSVRGDIIQASYNGKVVQDLTEPITLLFKRSKNSNDSKCVYWDFQKNQGIGGWSTEGCWKGNKKEEYDVCFCNHLTCFAQLINYNDEAFNGIHAIVLDIITIIGCSLSILGLLMVFTTFCLFKKWRRSLSNKILVNLSFSVFCSIVIFLGGINQTWNLILCRSVAVSLHYFILASFGWMLVEAVHQYLKFVKVVGTYIPRFLWKASVSAWGVPILPIIGVLVYDSTLYDGTLDDDSEIKICWMSSTGFIYAFLPPLALTMLVNLIMFFLIIHGAVCGRARVNSTMSERSLFMSQLSMAICVFFLLGFTWIFGLLSVWKGRLLFSYLFCIFNTLQGFFIFLFHICRERTARRFWREFLSVITKVPVSASEPVNSNNVHSGRSRSRLENVTYNQGGGILVLPRRESAGTIKSVHTISTVAHSRASFCVRP